MQTWINDNCPAAFTNVSNYITRCSEPGAPVPDFEIYLWYVPESKEEVLNKKMGGSRAKLIET